MTTSTIPSIWIAARYREWFVFIGRNVFSSSVDMTLYWWRCGFSFVSGDSSLLVKIFLHQWRLLFVGRCELKPILDSLRFFVGSGCFFIGKYELFLCLHMDFISCLGLLLAILYKLFSTIYNTSFKVFKVNYIFLLKFIEFHDFSFIFI